MYTETISSKIPKTTYCTQRKYYTIYLSLRFAFRKKSHLRSINLVIIYRENLTKEFTHCIQRKSDPIYLSVPLLYRERITRDSFFFSLYTKKISPGVFKSTNVIQRKYYPTFLSQLIVCRDKSLRDTWVYWFYTETCSPMHMSVSSMTLDIQ